MFLFTFEKDNKIYNLEVQEIMYNHYRSFTITNNTKSDQRQDDIRIFKEHANSPLLVS
jgi:hypothetical protein